MNPLFFLCLFCFSVPLVTSHGSEETTPFTLKASPMHGDLSSNCFICENVVGSLFTFLNGSHAEEDIEKAIDALCAVLPGSLKKGCEKLAHQVANFLVVLPKLADQQDYSPFALCSMYDQCTVQCCESTLPEQVHLSFTDNKDEMAVTWTTRNRDDSIVMYGLSPNALHMNVTGASHTYTSGGWAGWIHIAKMTGLKPGTQYFYSVGSSAGFSKVFNFYTERPADDTTPTKIVVYGDMGANKESDQMIERIAQIFQQHQADFVIHDGDISYADGFQQRWDIFMRKIEAVAAYTPYMVTPGNHEIGVIGLLNTTLGYPYRFSLPGKNLIGTELDNLFYSYNYHNVHVIAIDTESILDTPEITREQRDWLENDLKSVDRQKYPWVFVYGHRPLYCSNTNADCTHFAEYLREKLESLFYKYKVDLVFMAHKHDYERMYPLYQNQPTMNYINPGKPTYVLNGAGGNREGVQHFPSQRPQWSAAAISEWGYGVVTIFNNTVLRWDFYTAENNQIADTFTLISNH
eukprot:TRINITY_DN1112_c0_g2_i1.p1 TRINITY_DN1112_c0_g2~~TRINITY_DN1112_c0_g2_i1.p1  ORF type:complete len:519 (+),score=87.76 TRINITY_DN1112_c0_g2_i1:17-1573(+)